MGATIPFTNIDLTEFDGQVVAGSGHMVWTRADLQTLFTKVIDANRPVTITGGLIGTPWKERIDAIIRVGGDLGMGGDWELFGIREAVIFFTGSVPTLTAMSRGYYRVKAAGYYVAIGA